MSSERGGRGNAGNGVVTAAQAGVAARVRRWLSEQGVRRWSPQGLMVVLASGACTPLLLSGQADPGLAGVTVATFASVGGNVLAELLTAGIKQLRKHPAEQKEEKVQDWLEERFTQVLEAGGEQAVMLEAELALLLNEVDPGQAAVAEAVRLGYRDAGEQMRDGLAELGTQVAGVGSRLEDLHVTAAQILEYVRLLLKQAPAGPEPPSSMPPTTAPVAGKVRDALVEVEARVSRILAGVKSAFNLIKGNDKASLEAAEINAIVGILDPILGEAARVHLSEWRRFKSLETKAKMGELYWPDPIRIDAAEQAFVDLHQGILGLLMSLQPVSGPTRPRAEIDYLLSCLLPVAFHLFLDLGDFSVELTPELDADDWDRGDDDPAPED